MIPTLARPGDVAPGQFGPMSRAPAWRTASDRREHVERGNALGDAEDRADAGPDRLEDRVRRAGGRDVDAARIRRRSPRTASATVSKTGTRPSRAVWPPLPGVIPATMFVPYSSIAREWNSPSRPVMPWTTRRVSRPTRMLTTPPPSAAATALAAASSRLVAVSNRASVSSRAASSAFVPTMRTTIGTSRVCRARASMSPRATSSPRVMPPKMFTRIAVTFGSARMSRIAAVDLVGPRAAADVEEVGRLAAGPLDEVHRRHRQAGPVDHAADRPVELDEADPLGPGDPVGRVLLVEVAQVLEARMAGQRGVVEGDLGIEALEAERLGAVGPHRSDDRQRVDLDEVGVVGDHRPDEALGDGDRRLEVAAQAEREGHPAGLPVEQAEVRMGVDPDDRVRPLGGDLLDLDAALGRAHEQDPPGPAIEHRAEVELADDVGGRRHEDLADRDALDVHAEDAPGDGLRVGGGGRELHPAGLAAAADEHLGLDDDPGRTEGEGPLGGAPGLARRPRDLPGGDGQALGRRGATWRRLPGSSRRLRGSGGPSRGGRQGGRHQSGALVGVVIGGRPIVPRDPRARRAGVRQPPAVGGGARPVRFGHVPPCHAHPRRRHRPGARGGGPAGPRGDRRRVRMACRRRRRGCHGRVRHAAARPRPRFHPARPGRPQGADHDAGRGGVPERQRHAPPGARACTPTSARPGR